MVSIISRPQSSGGGGSSVECAIKTYADLTGFDGGVAFTVTGAVQLNAFGIIGSTGIASTSGGTLLTFGTADVALMGATLDGSELVANSVWTENGNGVARAAGLAVANTVINNADLVLSPDTDDITQGSLTLYVLWEPVTTGATVVAT